MVSKIITKIIFKKVITKIIQFVLNSSKYSFDCSVTALEIHILMYSYIGVKKKMDMQVHVYSC